MNKLCAENRGSCRKLTESRLIILITAIQVLAVQEVDSAQLRRVVGVQHQGVGIQLVDLDIPLCLLKVVGTRCYQMSQGFRVPSQMIVDAVALDVGLKLFELFQERQVFFRVLYEPTQER